MQANELVDDHAKVFTIITLLTHLFNIHNSQAHSASSLGLMVN